MPRRSSRTAKASVSATAGGTQGGGRYLVTILGGKPSRYAPERLRALKTKPTVLVWLESDGSGTMTVSRREGKTMKLRNALRGQSLRAIESLFHQPFQRIDQLFPVGAKASKTRAFERLRKEIDSRDAHDEGVLLKRGGQEGGDLVSLRAPEGRLCVLVEREPDEREPSLRSPGARGPRLEARKASYDEILNLLTVEARGVSPSHVLIDSLDLTVLVDGMTLHLYDASAGERFGPGLGYAERIRVEPNSVGPWRWFCFDGPRQKLKPSGRAGSRTGIMTLRNLDGRTLRAAIRISKFVHHPDSPLHGMVPSTSPGAVSPEHSEGGAADRGATEERQPNDKSDSVAN